MSDLTSVQVYREDHDFLKRKQREVSAERNAWVPLPDLIHELIEAVNRDGEGA